MKIVAWCSGMTGQEDIDDSTSLAARVTGDSSTLPSSEPSNKRERTHSCYVQVWLVRDTSASASDLLFDAILSVLPGGTKSRFGFRQSTRACHDVY